MRNSERVGGRALFRGAGVAVGAFLGATVGLAVGMAGALLVEFLGIPTEPFLLLTLAMFVFPLLGGIVGATVGTIMVGRVLRGERLGRRVMVIVLIAASAIPAVVVVDLIASGDAYVFPGDLLPFLIMRYVVPALALGVIVGVVALLGGIYRRATVEE